MTKRRRRSGKQSTRSKPSLVRWPQVGAIGAVVLLVVAVLIFKNHTAEAPKAEKVSATGTAAVSQTQARVTPTLPEALGQTQATASLAQAEADVAAEAPTLELPEPQLDRLLAAGQPTLAFFHSNNCVQCIKMMDVVGQIYPEFDGTVALVDVNVYDQRNTSLLQRAGIRAIPTQIFIDSQRQREVVMGAMTPEDFRERLQALAATSAECGEGSDLAACQP